MVGPLRCMVSTVAWITKRKRAGARLSPCLTPDVEYEVVCCQKESPFFFLICTTARKILINN